MLQYRDALENPPVLVTCDMDRFVIRTNFTGTAPATYRIALDQLGEPKNLDAIRSVFFDPERLKPGKTSTAITQEAAERFAEIAESMRKRGLDSAQVARFLDRIVFCLFAEDIGLLPDMVFTRIVERSAADPARFSRLIGQLFEAMASGGEFGLEAIRHFNGHLFEDASVLDVTPDEMERVVGAAGLDWSAIDPTIFGTLFERGLDPSKRAQLGAHFTSKEDIEILVDAVIMQPLRREWEETRMVVESLLATGRKSPASADKTRETTDYTDHTDRKNSNSSVVPLPLQFLPPSVLSVPSVVNPVLPSSLPSEPASGARKSARPLSPAARRKAHAEADATLHRFLLRLQRVTILDPACGSGNFLYVALQKLKDLEKEAIVYGMDREIGYFPMVGPWQLHGIEINPYAHELAQMTVWIGWLQWIRFNGFGTPAEPILRPMEGNFQLRDSILDLSDPASPKEPDWPEVEFIVGNPPFLGGNQIRKELGGTYVDALFRQYTGRMPAFADLCCYWFEKARAQIEKGHCKRVGLLATQGIRGGANREVLKRIKESGDIFWAQSDRPWILDGANVHVSMVGFDGGEERNRILDGKTVSKVNPNLTASLDTTGAAVLKESSGICFMGPSPKAPFDVDENIAKGMLSAIGNPNGRPNSDVVRPVASGVDLAGVSRRKWTIDFALMPMEYCTRYEAPFEYARQNVYPIRTKNRRASYAARWWQYAEARPGMRAALRERPRFIATPEVSKHRLFVWVSPAVLCNQQVLVFARSDDYFFGVLHSRVHEVWARAQGTQVRERESGFRYTPTTCFETFPLPWPPGQEPGAEMLKSHPQIRSAAGGHMGNGNADEEDPQITQMDADGPSKSENRHPLQSMKSAKSADIFSSFSETQPRSAPPVAGVDPPSFAPREDPRVAAISEAARELNELRERWLNPPEWTRQDILEFPGTLGGPWTRYIDPATVDASTKIGVVRYPRIVPRDDPPVAGAAQLKKRTLTNLYNERPAWLDLAHRKLDAAVFAAYGWEPSISDEAILERLLALNLERAHLEPLASP